ncbi:MAG: hypothetical protein QM820_47090 [Minicystis sp.]
MIQQAYATLRDIDEFGIAKPSLASIPKPQKLRALKAASGRLAPYLRKRYKLPLRVELDADDFDISGLTGGATVTYALLANVNPQKAQDVTVKFPAGGTVGNPGITYAISYDAGLTFGSPSPLPLSGQITIDGYTFTVVGTITTNDSFSYSTRVDYGVCEATVTIATWLLLHNRGLDPKTLEDLQKRHDAAMAWAKVLGEGEGDLETSADTTPELDEGGQRGDGQQNPWDWLDEGIGQ